MIFGKKNTDSNSNYNLNKIIDYPKVVEMHNSSDMTDEKIGRWPSSGFQFALSTEIIEKNLTEINEINEVREKMLNELKK